MDHIPSLPRSYKGNTELLIWVDLFTGYVIAKASSSRSAQTVAESYEECVFWRFGASEMIRHDREPGALKMYVRDLDQKDWDEYAERLTFAINTAHDRIRGDTSHYLVYEVGSEVDAGGYTASRMFQTARSRRAAVVLSSPAILSAVPETSQHQIEGSHRNRVKEGYARKLAHLWHGPFRVAETINEFSVKLEIACTRYQIFPVVHVSKLKLVKDFPDRPRTELTVDESDCVDFDEILLPEDSWVPDLGADEYEVERISDASEMPEEQIGLRQVTCGQIPQFTELVKLEIPDLIALINRLITVLEGCVAIGKRTIPILGDLCELCEDTISIGGDLRQGSTGECKIDQCAISVYLSQGGRTSKGFVPRVVGLTLQAADLLLQVPDLVTGLESLLAQPIAICLGIMKILAGDLVSLAVLEHFHVPDVGSQLADLQIEMISIADEAIPCEVALAELALQALKDCEGTITEQVERTEKTKVFCVQASSEVNDLDSMLCKEWQDFALMSKHLHLAQGAIAHHAEVLDLFKKQLAAAESESASSLHLLRVECERFKAGLTGYTAQAKELNRRLKEAVSTPCRSVSSPSKRKLAASSGLTGSSGSIRLTLGSKLARCLKRGRDFDREDSPDDSSGADYEPDEVSVKAAAAEKTSAEKIAAEKAEAQEAATQKAATEEAARAEAARAEAAEKALTRPRRP
ncbi:reverse transcriptase [Phytophthora megakarya]|uniref:Reverse transcriptase n=1 Tax=Phytophthora megakarya TaxID=4795 RepID=A0A225VPZ4_9STRA|nr:reverse transcriptase [Phytophthora megakarya]